MEKTYLFTVTLQGSGDTPEDAWEDAVEAFLEDPGEPHVIEEVEEKTEEESEEEDDWCYEAGRPAHMRDEDWD